MQIIPGHLNYLKSLIADMRQEQERRARMMAIPHIMPISMEPIRHSVTRIRDRNIEMKTTAGESNFGV